jgi:hypothetical protein
MLKIIIGIFIFCITLFFYLHIQFHFKTSDDLEIYEIEQASKDKMEEICDLRHPVLFDSDEDGNKIIHSTNKRVLIENYPVFEIKIRDTTDSTSESNLCVPLSLDIATKLFEEDKKGAYFSEGNMDFLTETGAIKNMTYNDEFLRPYLVSNCNYDVMMGSNGVETPLRYEVNYRNYFIVTQGSVKIKLMPPKSSRYLYPINDYENFEFKSQINPWNPQAKFRADFDKIKCLEIVLTPGKFLFIPAYWWHSFKFSDDTSISCFRYRTYMNTIAIMPNLLMYALQNQNVERQIAKKIDIQFLQNNKPEIIVSGTTSLNDIPIIEDKYNEIPDILIPKEETESFSQDGESLLNNDNIQLLIKERNDEPLNDNQHNAYI